MELIVRHAAFIKGNTGGDSSTLCSPWRVCLVVKCQRIKQKMSVKKTCPLNPREKVWGGRNADAMKEKSRFQDSTPGAPSILYIEDGYAAAKAPVSAPECGLRATRPIQCLHGGFKFAPLAVFVCFRCIAPHAFRYLPVSPRICRYDT